MINLIKNAIDAVEKNGEVTIRLYQIKNGKIIISIEDNGCGIPDKFLPKLFDPYFTTKSDSMGLGLYMTKMIIEKHMQGTIEVKNPSSGTIFIISL